MKQVFTGVLISALISIGLVGCTVADLDKTTEPTPEVTAPVVEEPQRVIFEELGFALTFPSTWGAPTYTIKKVDGMVDQVSNVKITGQNEETLLLDAVQGDHSRFETSYRTPSHLIYLGNPADPNNQILDTFVVVMEGKYFNTAMLPMILFDPDDPKDAKDDFIAFTNQEADEIFGRSDFPTTIIENCIKFEGHATIVVKDYVQSTFDPEKDLMPEGAPYTAILVEVLEKTVPTCQNPLM